MIYIFFNSVRCEKSKQPPLSDFTSVYISGTAIPPFLTERVIINHF